MFWRWTAYAAAAFVGVAVAGPASAVDFVIDDHGAPTTKASPPRKRGSSAPGRVVTGQARPPQATSPGVRPASSTARSVPTPTARGGSEANRRPVANSQRPQTQVISHSPDTSPLTPNPTKRKYPDPSVAQPATRRPTASPSPQPDLHVPPVSTDTMVSDHGIGTVVSDDSEPMWVDGSMENGWSGDGGYCGSSACDGCDANWFDQCMSDSGSGDCGPCGSGNPFFVNAWLAQGFTGNFDNPDNNFNLPVTFNDRANEYMMNQVYVSLGRRVRDCGECWDLGGRIDLLYGTDYFFTQANGLETEADGSPKWNGDGPRAGGTASLYGLALPQFYAELYAPVLSGITFRFGHFYTTLGYESVMAPSNFFYSKAYTMQYGEPFTHTGMVMSMPISSQFCGHFGYTRGVNTFEDINGRPGYLAGMTWSPDELTSVAFALHTGREDNAGINNRVTYSVVLTRQLSDRLRYVAQHDFGSEANAETDRDGLTDSAKWYGLNQYFFYDISRNVTWGTRVEWFRDQDNARVLAIPDEDQVTGGNYVGLTNGVNIRAGRNWIFRPELRYDWSDVVPPFAGGMFNDFTEDGQVTLGFDVIFQM